MIMFGLGVLEKMVSSSDEAEYHCHLLGGEDGNDHGDDDADYIVG